MDVTAQILRAYGMQYMMLSNSTFKKTYPRRESKYSKVYFDLSSFCLRECLEVRMERMEVSWTCLFSLYLALMNRNRTLKLLCEIFRWLVSSQNPSMIPWSIPDDARTFPTQYYFSPCTRKYIHNIQWISTGSCMEICGRTRWTIG